MVLRAYSIEGKLLQSRVISLQPRASVHTILNDLIRESAFVDTYGLYELSLPAKQKKLCLLPNFSLQATRSRFKGTIYLLICASDAR